MKRLLIGFAALAAFCGPEEVLAVPIVLDFEEFEGMSYIGGTQIPDEARLADQFADLYGVVFASEHNDYVAVVALGSAHAPSGLNGIGSASWEDCVTYDSLNPIVVSFFDPADSTIPGTTDYVSVRGDMWGATWNTVRMEGYDIGGNLIAEYSGQDYGGAVHSLSSPGMHTVKWIGPATGLYGPYGVGIDDVTFNPVAPIPEPSTFIIWSLLGAFALTLGWWRRSRRGRWMVQKGPARAAANMCRTGLTRRGSSRAYRRTK